MKLRLYHYWRSSSSWRVRWALLLKEIPCEFIAINLLNDESESADHLSRNPLGYVPVLEFLENLEPFRFLSESMAIIHWLDLVFPEPKLLSGTPLEQARIMQLSELVNAGIQPLQNLNVSQYHSNNTSEQRKWNFHWIQKGLTAYEILVKETAGKFSMGNQISVADLFLIPQCYNAIRNQIELADFPLIKKIYETSLQTRACQQSAPENFKPAD